MSDPESSTPPEPHEKAGDGASHHNLLQAGRRLKKLLRPDGRRVHIASTPEEHTRLQKTLPKIEPDENFDCYLHGSPDHVRSFDMVAENSQLMYAQLDAVREIHAHHEQRRERLRDTHGDVYNEFERVKADLDALAEELHTLTDHGVALDANFSKFGYDAHIS